MLALYLRSRAASSFLPRSIRPWVPRRPSHESRAKSSLSFARAFAGVAVLAAAARQPRLTTIGRRAIADSSLRTIGFAERETRRPGAFRLSNDLPFSCEPAAEPVR
jgi:hypothetical protein